MRFVDKTVVVTGAGTGVGSAVAGLLAAEGARVCLVGRRAETLDAVIRQLPDGSAVRCVADVSVEADVERIVATALTFGGGRLDVLVNNAAVSPSAALDVMDLGQWNEALAVNLTGPMLLSRAAIPHFKATGSGSVVNVASVGAFRPVPKEAAYCVAKAGLVMLTQQAALDYGPSGIRFNAVCPGRLRTPMGDADMQTIVGRDGGDLDSAYQKVSRFTPLRRVGTPDEVASAIAFLASDDAAYITGAVLTADGGSTLVNASGLAFL